PRPGSTAAPSGARSTRTGPRTARAGTAEFAPGPETGRPTPPPGPPHTREHQQWVAPGGAADGQGSQRSSRSGDKARSLPAQRIKDEPDTDEQSPRVGRRDRRRAHIRLVPDCAAAPPTQAGGDADV